MTPSSLQTQAAVESTDADLQRQFDAIAHAHHFSLDPSQKQALHSFQRLQRELVQAEQQQRSWLRLWSRPQSARGIYLWGAVGRGKSFLMDEFFRVVPVTGKQRTHFHRFMQGIHHQLRALQGQPDPLKAIAAQVAQSTRLLCLDEFHVTDIGDAMLMREFLDELFKRGVALVTTSNEHPDQLYAHGLQRALFVPAIALIKRHMEVLQLDGGNDYRLRALTRAGVYHHPLGAAADAALENGFVSVAGEEGEAAAELEIEGRTLIARRLAPGTAWFDFAQLCEGARGTADYIELARRYHTVLLSRVPQFRLQQRDAMRRFTWLIDELYDRQVKLMLSAEVAAEHLYDAVGAPADTQRTRSRLIEMQSTQYLRLPHLG